MIITTERDRLIQFYFELRFSNKEILECLSQNHGYILSIRTLKRITSKLNLFRRKCHSDILEVAIFIANEITEAGRNHGYRWMHLKCLSNGLIVSKETVRCLLAVIDSEGVCNRKKRRLRRRKYECQKQGVFWRKVIRKSPNSDSEYCESLCQSDSKLVYPKSDLHFAMRHHPFPTLAVYMYTYVHT